MYSKKRGHSEVRAGTDRLNPWVVGSLVIGIVSAPVFVLLGAVWLVPFGVGRVTLGCTSCGNWPSSPEFPS